MMLKSVLRVVLDGVYLWVYPGNSGGFTMTYITNKYPTVAIPTCGECFLRASNIQNTDIACVVALLRLPKTVPRNSLNACLEHILCQLQSFELKLKLIRQTAKPRKALKEH
jgi:hypothetical protein